MLDEDTTKEKAVHASPQTRAATDPDADNSVAALFELHHERVFRIARRITGDASDAEDVLQTVFLRIIRREEPPLRADDAASYLHRAATNASLDLLRRRKAARPNRSRTPTASSTTSPALSATTRAPSSETGSAPLWRR